MTSNQIYEIIDSKVPGGDFSSLDKEQVRDRKIFLTRISMDQLNDMFEYSKDRRLYRCFEFKPHETVEETRKYLQRLLDAMGTEKIGRRSIYWFIRSVESGKAIGSICLVEIDIQRDSAAWGYAISPEHWGKGLILEAQLLVMKYFFEDLKMNRLHGTTPIDNEAVLASVAAAGFKREGVLREYYKYDGNVRKDGVIYGLLAKEYFQSKEATWKCGLSSELLSLDRIREIFSSVLKVPHPSVNQDTEMSDIANWDSLNHINLIMAIEKECGIKFRPVEITKATTVRSILDIVNTKEESAK